MEVRSCFGMTMRVGVSLAIVAILLSCAFFMHDSAPGQCAGVVISNLETRVYGQTSWLVGGPASLRITVSDHVTGKPVAAKVKLSLIWKGAQNEARGPQPLFDGSSNKLGTIDASFIVPKIATGPYEMMIDVDTAIGKDNIRQAVTLTESTQIMLSTDKPLYQPGQTIHLRALALDIATRSALKNVPLTFEVEDGKGNKVFKQQQTLSDYGVASTDFVLADEVNMGRYTLRAFTATGTTEKNVQVERYVLPKFKVALTTDKSYYQPGDTVKGTIQADYFFGKPVKGSYVLNVNTTDIGVKRIAELQGDVDANGHATFETILPLNFIGQSFEQGKGMVEFYITLKDTANQSVGQGISVPVVKDPILLAIVPEAKTLTPNLSNRIYIAAASPDGKPLARVMLKVYIQLNNQVFPTRTAPTTLVTDDLGIATYYYTPDNNSVSLFVEAQGPDGKTATASHPLGISYGNLGIILRTDKSLAKVGERISMTALTTATQGTVYLDVLRNKQTILTRAMDIEAGQANINLPITGDMVGTLTVHAYRILPNEEIVRDTRVIVVTPADDLLISVAADKETYVPGSEAKLTFTVTDQDMRPVLAALGVSIVDESVFALSELKPGMEKIYFMLEKELLEPKYEIHGLKPVDLIIDKPTAQNRPMMLDRERQLVATVLFAGLPLQQSNEFKINTYPQRLQKMNEEANRKMQEVHGKISAYLLKNMALEKTDLSDEQILALMLKDGILKPEDTVDIWGNKYKFNGMLHVGRYDSFFQSSAGADGRWDTDDDLRIEDYMYRCCPAVTDVRLMSVTGAANVALGIVADPLQLRWGVEQTHGDTLATDDTAGSAPARVRSYFPETMYWNPALITGADGKVSLTIPMADSITTWRMSLLGNSANGQLGSMTAPLRVFQDFFVDIDLPVALTQHDSMMLPVTVYNYLPVPQTVNITLEKGPWFTLDGPDTQTLNLTPNQVTVVYFPITVDTIGNWPLTIQAKGTKMSDAVRRNIDVLPDGKETRTALNETLAGKVEKTVNIPADSIADASNIWVKFYPGNFSQVAEGLDGILRMPGGCFEQTSSTTYPNVLILNYLKKTKQVNPELQMKAEGYINAGYQRLLTFECKNGGFSWFGGNDGHQILTAYGLLEFSDMAKVHEVDPALIARTQQWLVNQQKADGTWSVPDKGIAEGITTRQEGTLRCTAYIAWALADSGFKGAQLATAVQYVKDHRAEATDPYTQAIILNLLASIEKDSEITAEVANALIKSASVTDKNARWQTGAPTYTGAETKGADLETTGLAAFGLVKWGHDANFTNKVLNQLISSKDSFGTWSSTQGTVWALKALLYATTAGGSTGKVTVLANGKAAGEFTITKDDTDVMRQLDLSKFVQMGDNKIELQMGGNGGILYQIVTRYYTPWNKVVTPDNKPAMSIAVAYDKTTLATDDTANVTVTIKNNLNATVEMPLIDLGIPPGFTIVPDQLETAVKEKTISKYTIAARQLIVYMEKIDPNASVTLKYELKAKYPIHARTPQSSAYPYYNPEKVAISAPQNIVVMKK
ncbi:MAG: MG2 domain-containing protein [bacterium]